MSKGQEVMRAEFEAWFNVNTNNNDGVAFHVGINGKYCFTDIETAWQSWQAARQQAPAEQAAPQPGHGEDVCPRYKGKGSHATGPIDCIAMTACKLCAQQPDQSARIAELEKALKGLRGCITDTRGPDAHLALERADAALAKHGEAGK